MTDRLLRLMLFVHVFLFALVVEVFWGTWFSLSRSISAIVAPAICCRPIVVCALIRPFHNEIMPTNCNVDGAENIAISQQSCGIANCSSGSRA